MIQRLKRLFGAPLCALQAAALPWRENGGEVEILMVTSRGTGRWVLPKGWPKSTEFLHETAAREAREEAGLSGSVSAEEAGSYYYVKADEGREDRPCKVKVYPMQVEDVASVWPEKNQRQRRWMKADEAAAAVAEPDLAELIRNFDQRVREAA
jgi:8-oxo-dGTP pyrophosphatase MutT (NUDIX family)